MSETATIPERQAALDALYARTFPPRAVVKARPAAESTVGATEPDEYADAQLIVQARSAKNGEKFARLWEGDTEGYGSQSEADAALCFLLAFWTGPDEERIDRLFRLSGLMRDKWERDDYRRNTIAGAMARKDFHTPPNVPGMIKRQRVNSSPPPPGQPDEAAFYGLAGDIVRAIDPSTEADRVAVLFNFLAAFGNIIGDGPHWIVSGTKHPLRIFPVLVGDTGKGRKGTSWGSVRQILALAAPEWARQCVKSGLSSGEGLIHHVRDPRTKEMPEYEGGKRSGKITRYETVVDDSGVTDKRLFIIESEFASTLKVMGREGNTLSPVIRQAWESGDLQTLTKHSPDRSTGAHVTILAHITKEELLRHLSDIEAANGFANRFLWPYVRRSKYLPDGGSLDDNTLTVLADRLRSIIATAKGVGRIARDAVAGEMWRAVYGPLSDGKPGLVGAILGRAEAQVMRLAALYAVLDGTARIAPPHLEAALALWKYLDASATYIFGESLGDPVADKILGALREDEAGLTKEEISALFGRNQSATRINTALDALESAGKVQRSERKSGGRPATIWRAI